MLADYTRYKTEVLKGDDLKIAQTESQKLYDDASLI